MPPLVVLGHECTAHAGRGRHRAPGLGLGLYIASEIAHAHHGTITVTSAEQEGTTFRLTLPRAA